MSYIMLCRTFHVDVSFGQSRHATDVQALSKVALCVVAAEARAGSLSIALQGGWKQSLKLKLGLHFTSRLERT
jgi:hypothetical protein